MSGLKARAFPAKRFFVDMLIRDIELQDSILDLLDNCVDGAMRNGVADSETPYAGYNAKITLNENSFSITDNCGGIPLELAKQYAFRLGRADASRDVNMPTVGVYGIGMKRAIFKIGREAAINSSTKNESFVVSISPEWLSDDDEWELPLEEKNIATEVGTEIKISQLRDGIPRLFSDDTGFIDTLRKAISAYYGFIIENGCEVYIKAQTIAPEKIGWLLDENAFANDEGIAPFVYKGQYDGVDIDLCIGLYRGLASEQEEEDALQGKPATAKAGWTIICNDRVVLYADKTRVTGWGEATVPGYHTQFVSIAGTVNFRSNDPGKLPLTTTKRGVDGNSELYLAVKEFMREGLKIFTDFTNKWKHSTKELQALNSQPSFNVSQSAIGKIPSDRWSKVHRSIGGEKFKPKLPMPKEENPLKQIRFSRYQRDILKVAKYFFDDTDISYGDVGAKCFDEIMERVNK